MSDQAKSLVPLSLVSPGVKDARQEALATVFGQALAELDLDILTNDDPMTCDARLLPYLICEKSAQAFIDPEMPELVVRRILSAVWMLKSLHGRDIGVRLGMKLLGFDSTIIQWFQTTPKGTPGTHVLKVFADEVFDPETGAFNPVDIRSINRMNDACKRWSQETELRLGITLPESGKPAFGTGCAVVFSERADIQPATTPTFEDDAQISVGTAITTNAMFTIEEAA